ncbi:ribonuclease E inhibitor RraA/Dimethylmenaquinone methyltransferase [Stachybotrys elegans]|uniref:Ribonuclease E inhibitor RraA/Dimethylmenaquinone methyltransferase n=1 Tax=Stachybotrys elegans TaxID=80388 RepID=A0A8K0SC20_9HYPO|nr:ribonuclease E inhibitor RraA/Dimethylmenaquinone methyltransferase [Stachybotrys elegans]
MDPNVKLLRGFSTCDVSDALCKLKFPHGGVLSGLTMWSPDRQSGNTTIVGPAYTVQYVPLSDAAPKHPTHYIGSIPPGAVVFVSCPTPTPVAVYGGMMSTRAQASQAVGSVIDGRFRDLKEHRNLGYPVFARDISTAPPYGEVKVSAVQVPVRVQSLGQDVEVSPGDYIIGDADGAVVLRKELVNEVLPLMRQQVEADNLGKE